MFLERKKTFFFVANFKLACMYMFTANIRLFELIKYSNGRFCEFQNLITIPISWIMSMLCVYSFTSCVSYMWWCLETKINATATQFFMKTTNATVLFVFLFIWKKKKKIWNAAHDKCLMCLMQFRLQKYSEKFQLFKRFKWIFRIVSLK